MDQHPVPQHIASYEFRLIGDMTLKQFAQLAAGAILGLVIYALPLSSLIKWPLIIAFGFSGFAFAFLPINERPLSIWVIAFFKAVFSPTQFIWQKASQKPEMFDPIILQAPINKQTKYSADKESLNQYLATLPYGNNNKTPLDQQEESFLKEIGNLFQLAHPSQTTSSVPYPQPVNPKPSIVQQPKPAFSPTPPPRYQPQPDLPQPEKAAPIKSEPVVLPQKIGRPRKPVAEAIINPALLIPTPPTRPNLIVGMVLDSEGKIIEGAILEIRDLQGIPVRALKTSKLGQFLIVTPLENGVYEIETEKEGFNFDIIKIEVKGQIIQPIEIRAKAQN